MSSYEMISDFANRIHAKLTVMKNGEHWFHTEELITCISLFGFHPHSSFYFISFIISLFPCEDKFLKLAGYHQASLSVQKKYAVKMYRNLGFQIIDENDEKYIMLYKF